MKYHAHNLLAIQRRFPTELACRKYLAARRWPQGFWCTRCGGSTASWIRTRRLYQCRGGRVQVSLTAGTIFHKTRVPLRTWFWLVVLMGQNKHGLSMLQAHRWLGLGSYKTVWAMAHKIRTAMAHRETRDQLAGLIELDDAEFGPRVIKGQRRYKPVAPKTVRVAVSTRRGRPAYARLEIVAPGGFHAPAMARRVFAPKARLRTDGGHAFSPLTKLGYRHEAHPKMTRPELDRLLPWVHTIIANAKRFLVGTHHQEAPKHLQRFLDEFSYRFNRRWDQGRLFDRLLTACVTTGSVTVADLTG